MRASSAINKLNALGGREMFDEHFAGGRALMKFVGAPAILRTLGGPLVMTPPVDLRPDPAMLLLVSVPCA